jgi:inner membrane protein
VASIGHLAVGLAAARFDRSVPRGRTRLPRWATLLLLPALSVLPDLDVVAFLHPAPYRSMLGHRGASHSIVTSIGTGALVGALGRRLAGAAFWPTAGLASVAMGSHGILDMLTDGGGGIAWLWPLSTERFFAPWRPIPVSPIGLRYLSARGLSVALTEIVYFLPLLLYAFWPRGRRAPRCPRVTAAGGNWRLER